MVDGDVIARRLLSMSEALADLERPEARDPLRLASDRVLRAAVERWLQVAIEACVDIANHIIASNAWTPPESGRAAFRTLTAHGLLDTELAERLGRAVGLRNLLVHDYASLELGQIADVVARDLDDLRAFARVAAALIDSEK